MRINYHNSYDLSAGIGAFSADFGLLNPSIQAFIPAVDTQITGIATHPLLEFFFDLDPSLLLLELYIATIFILYISSLSYPKEASA